MSPWGVQPLCTPGCAAHAAPRVPRGAAVRRCAGLARVLARAFARGERLAEPETLRAEARRVLAALGVRLSAVPGPLTVPGVGTGTLVVANHVSWLDVIALLAVEPVPFVAKREVGAWPVIGTLVRRAGTRFLDREGLRALPGAVAELSGGLRAGRSVLVFPQATTWCGADGGRFARATFQAAVDAGAPVRPVTVEYAQRGRTSTAPGFFGDEAFAASLRRVAEAGELTARVRAHPPLTGGGDRRALAAAAREAVTGVPVPSVRC
ncbi:lysophospholipid acyltransferase family protein [Streptomyces sp. NPDC048172]|uniref:lysophospholipid acyltransferase family protein n=1 Tax=Streptomyces sp. NPDC048172 TaxID=3365505 RepID=UPI00371DA183